MITDFLPPIAARAFHCRSSFGSFAISAAMRRASSRVIAGFSVQSEKCEVDQPRVEGAVNGRLK
jgi:hypothetical protein